ncbi:MAG: hypothetical protein DDT41_00230 [candidate division WS2 bacterium]|nr:hypothetical protein [Candidatus Psychracetigena formicireducens]
MNRQTKLFLNLVIVGTIILAGYAFILRTREKEKTHPPLMIREGLYQLGDIVVDTIKGEIQFRAQVREKKGWVQHLVYLDGYKWLREESAIISQGKLSDLQKAIALLDWRLWDELWHRKNQKSTDPVSWVARNQKLKLFIKWDEKEIAGQELVLTEDNLEIEDLIFLGSPYFDHIALEAPPGVDCRLCPVFPLEEKALRELFIRESGQLGYELNLEKMPYQGAEVTIIVRSSR